MCRPEGLQHQFGGAAVTAGQRGFIALARYVAVTLSLAAVPLKRRLALVLEHMGFLNYQSMMFGKL